MSYRLSILSLLLLVLSACAHQTSAPTPVSNYVGIATEPLPASAAPEYMAHEFRALNKALSDYSANKGWQVTQTADGTIRLETASAFAFDADSAELRASALDACAKFAQAAKAYSQTVIHIAATGRDTSMLNYRQSLADRRAAALAVYLDGQGLDDTRLRYEGVATSKASSLVILIKPIVAGAEPQAWMSPS